MGLSLEHGEEPLVKKERIEEEQIKVKEEIVGLETKDDMANDVLHKLPDL